MSILIITHSQDLERCPGFPISQAIAQVLLSQSGA